MAKGSINTGADAQPVHTRTTADAAESQVVVLGVDGSDLVVDPRDLATQATVAAILAKIIASPATEATLSALLAAVDGLEANTTGLASQTTLAALLTELQAKADLSETQPVSAAALPLPAGAATSAAQTSAQTRLDLLATEAKLEAVRLLLAGTLAVSDGGGSLTVDGTVTASPPASSPVSYEQIVVAAAGGSAIGLTPPGSADFALVIPSVAVRWRDDATDPTAALGMPIAAGVPVTFDTGLSVVEFIAQGASAGVLDVAYYAV